MNERARILAVDDEVRGVELLQRILRRTADVDVAASGEEAQARLQVESYDVVISDQRMPGLSGVELLASVAEASPNTGRILLTGYADMGATIDAINDARVHAYLNKPCPPDQLRLTVGSVLEQVEMQRENTRLYELRNQLRDAAAGFSHGANALVAYLDPSDGEAQLHAKRMVEAGEQLSVLLEALDRP